MAEELTKTDVIRIKKEIRERKLEKRPELIEAVKEARAHGDLSENFEYHAAKREKNINESRIRYLDNMLRHAKIIEDNSEDDEVGINNTVKLIFEEMKKEDEFRIVTSIRGSSIRGLISIESPIGKAILGKKEGDRVEVVSETGRKFHVIIKELIKTGESKHDEIRSF